MMISTQAVAPDALETPIKSLDRARPTSIMLGCFRDTSRLSKLLKVFQRALALAQVDDNDVTLSDELVSLFDRNGLLSATWRHDDVPPKIRQYVETAWRMEGESAVDHQVVENDQPRIFDSSSCSAETSCPLT